MAKQKIDEVKKEIEEQKDEFYGEEAVGGSEMGLETDDDTKEMIEEVTGDEPEEEKPYSIAEDLQGDDLESDDTEE